MRRALSIVPASFRLRPSPLATRALVIAVLSSTVFVQQLSFTATQGVSAEADCGCGTDASAETSAPKMAPKSDRPLPIQFKDAEITNARTGDKKTFGDLWSDKPLIVAFLRRLG